VLALAYFAIDKFVITPDHAQPGSDPFSQQSSKQTNTAEEKRALTPVEATVEATTEAESTSTHKTIAVLPFINMSDDASNEYFSDGITEELLNLLAKIPELKVTSRSSAFSFKGQNIDIPTVAKKLNVDHILEGSVRKAGNRVRITAQLINVDSDTHIWSETYDRELTDVFGIQDEISLEVVRALQIQLFGRAPSTVSTDTRAYTLYLKGKHFHSLGEEESWIAARTSFNEAIAIDPDYAPAWAALSFTLSNLANLGHIELQEGYESARQAAIRALEIDDTLADAWAALASIQISHDWDWERARGTIQTALQYGPRNVVVLEAAAGIARSTGQPGQAVDFAQRAVELDPLSLSSLRVLGITYWASGLHEEAEKVYRQILELYPASPSTNAFVAASIRLQGRPEEAWQFLDASSDNLWQRFVSVLVLVDLGREQNARNLIQRLIDEDGNVMAYQIAEIFALLNESDKSFEWLERAYLQKDSGISQVSFDPFLVSLHTDPRWEVFLLKVGMLDYWKEYQAKRSSESPSAGGAE
jgi:adenylate cyclase